MTTTNSDNSGDNIGLFDLDGSLADYDRAVLAGLLELKCPAEPDIESVRDAFQILHLRARIELMTRTPNWWLNLEPIAMGFRILDVAREIGFQIHVLTQGPRAIPLAWKEKVEWCQRYLGNEVDIHITRNKGLVYGRFLYDDYPDYMMRWLRFRPRGLGIMPVNKDNKDFRHQQVIRWTGENLDEVQERLQAAFKRKSREPLL